MARVYRPKTALNRLEYSPLVNPLAQPQQVQTKDRQVKSSRAEGLIHAGVGENFGVAAVHQVEERDEAEFVKLFAAGVAASYTLSRTAQRVFQLVLEQYQRTPASMGFADSVNLFWFGEGIEGRDVDMKEDTFKRGLRELLDKRFLSPKGPTSFWTNPALFFKGDRVMFVKEYRRRSGTEVKQQRDAIESGGQRRLGGI
jgi:hypothetical protein